MARQNPTPPNPYAIPAETKGQGFSHPHGLISPYSITRHIKTAKSIITSKDGLTQQREEYHMKLSALFDNDYIQRGAIVAILTLSIYIAFVMWTKYTWTSERFPLIYDIMITQLICIIVFTSLNIAKFIVGSEFNGYYYFARYSFYFMTLSTVSLLVFFALLLLHASSEDIATIPGYIYLILFGATICFACDG